MDFEQELRTYQEHLPGWAEYEGKYVLIYGKDVVDFFSSYDDALKAGYEKFGLEPFLVKQIHALEQIHFISRLYVPRLTADVH